MCECCDKVASLERSKEATRIRKRAAGMRLVAVMSGPTTSRSAIPAPAEARGPIHDETAIRPVASAEA